jgi:hypothetical protein
MHRGGDKIKDLTEEIISENLLHSLMRLMLKEAPE